MENSNFSRRKFIKGTGLLLAGTGLLPSCNIFRMSGSSSAYDAKGLPTAMLGKTGVRIPRIAIGLGSRFCTIESAEEAFDLLNYALDNGLYYWDTAWAYENKKLGFTSEERLGEVLKNRRKEIFISTKVTSRDPDEAMRQIEASLKRLQTDHVDMLSMLMAMNHYNKATNPQERQEQAIPAAKTNDMGVMLMKVIRPRETIKELDPKDLVRYALSLKGPDGIVLGMDSLEVVKSNLEILRNFRPMEDSKMKEMAMQLTPFYNHENLPWMKSGYCDGNWA
ncbi:MAG: aldo/keto reductase [Bacteroidota bacterium]|nr:aldo/keto reductase [Bacteroidota bacterium]